MEYNNQIKQSNSFEKIRYQYCKELFERERDRKESLERKAQVILSIITLLLGVTFFKLTFFKDLKEIINNSEVSSFVIVSMFSLLYMLAICFLIALYYILKSISLQSYKEEHPKYLISSLFAPESNYIIEENEIEFYKATAMSYAIAIEQNSQVNDKKAIWIRYCWYSLIACVIFLSVFIFLYAYISFV